MGTDGRCSLRVPAERFSPVTVGREPLRPHIADRGAPHPPLFTADPDDARPAERWWRRASNDDVLAVSQYLLADYDQFDREAPLRLLREWKDTALCPAQYERGLEHAQTLQHYGYDPLVLAALRGSRLPGRTRLLIACAGLSPGEAHQFAGQRPVNLAVLTMLVALRASRCRPVFAA